jgi:hypothetical protein
VLPKAAAGGDAAALKAAIRRSEAEVAAGADEDDAVDRRMNPRVRGPCVGGR